MTERPTGRCCGPARTSRSLLELRARSCARRSWNAGCCIDQSWCGNSSSNASCQVSSAADASSTALARADQLAGRSAARRASATAVSSSSSSSTQRHARPTRAASSPESDSPKITSAAAACRPTSRCMRQRWPPPGWMPRSMNRGSKRAFGDARITSQASGRLTPAPITGPFTAATDGIVSRARARNPAYISRSDARGSSRSSTEPPAQNAGGVAVSTSAPTPGRRRPRRPPAPAGS